MARFDAVLFDAGGILVLPDPTVIGPLLAYYGGDPSIGAHHRAHYAGMKAKSDAGADEATWAPYNDAYVRAIGVASDDLDEAATVFDDARHAALWRWPIPESIEAVRALADAGVPMGVVSNAAGQIEAVLRRSVGHVGPGEHVEMRCIIDSYVVGVAKPDPRIFDFALPHFAEFPRDRIAYVGDSVTMDVVGATAAGLHPILLDPYDDHVGADFERIRSIRDLVAELVGA